MNAGERRIAEPQGRRLSATQHPVAQGKPAPRLRPSQDGKPLSAVRFLAPKGGEQERPRLRRRARVVAPGQDSRLTDLGGFARTEQPSLASRQDLAADPYSKSGPLDDDARRLGARDEHRGKGLHGRSGRKDDLSLRLSGNLHEGAGGHWIYLPASSAQASSAAPGSDRQIVRPSERKRTGPSSVRRISAPTSLHRSTVSAWGKP